MDFKAIFESIPGLYLVLLADTEFTIAWASNHFLSATGTRRDDIAGRSFFEVFHASHRELNRRELSELRQSLQWVLKHKESFVLLQKYYGSRTIEGTEELETKYWESMITPSLSKDGSVQYIILKITDAAPIVRSKEREEKQMLHTRALEELKRENMQKIKESNDQLEVLNRSLGKTIAELELANDELDSFCYSVSHDLHAPLRVISGYAKILLDDHSASLNSDARKMADRVRSNAQLMSRQVDALLAFSRMAKSDMKLTDVNMTEIAKNSLELALNGENKGIKLKIILNELLPVRADATLMGHVFTNLISNAIKYSSKSKRPVIDINSVNRKGKNVYTVKDNGVGFDMKYSGKLFGIFQRLHNREEYEGTGLGLALVKRIVIRHGGNVWAKSKPGKGTTFYFSLPSGN